MENKLKTYRVNYVNDAYWYQPSIWTFSRRSWASYPFRQIEDLIDKLELKYYPGGIIDLNKDPRFSVFNSVQKHLKTGISVNPSALKDKDNYLVYEVDENIRIILDDKSLKYLAKGLIFCTPLSYFKAIKEKEELTENQVLEFLYSKGFFEISKANK
ncbi:hypothetical protein MbovWib_04095 [Mycoplasmopsis bovis]|uniref:MPN499 family protein n=1 Tax=Mycoplasmopsis bovis TaxID=28903 RepID=UPI00279902FB